MTERGRPRFVFVYKPNGDVAKKNYVQTMGEQREVLGKRDLQTCVSTPTDPCGVQNTTEQWTPQGILCGTWTPQENSLEKGIIEQQ